MAISVITWPLYVRNNGQNRMKSVSAAVLADACETTGLNIVSGAGIQASSIVIGFTGDILEYVPDPSRPSSVTRISDGNNPIFVIINNLTGSRPNTNIKMKVYSGRFGSSTPSYTSYDLEYTSLGVDDDPTLVVIKRGSKAMITLINGSGPSNRIMGVLMDSSAHRAVVLKSDGSTIGDCQQSGVFNIRDATDREAPRAPEYAYGETQPPSLVNDERLVSMAPLAVPELRDVFSDVFTPIYMRSGQGWQQFDIGSDTFVSSGNPVSATGIQFVARFPAEVQSE